jgi:type I restriction enzyme S subunit
VYLFHFLNRASFRVSLEPFIRGTAMKNLSMKDLLARSNVPLPSLPEQRRIAEVLDRLDALRTKRRESLALFDDLTRSIFLETFGDPVKNERSWPETPLGALGDLERGVSKHRPRNAPSLLGGPYPLVQTGDVANSGGYITVFSSTYSERGLSQSRLWPAGTLCITIAANIAKTGILTFDACFPDSVVAFVADPPTTSYAQIWLSFWQKRLEDSAPESAQKNINLAILRNLMVPVPPLELRESFADRRRRVEQLRSRHLEHLTDLSSMFASLQQRAFAGEL